MWGDLSSQVQWWEEWQLRILVLGSLFLQLVLFVGSLTRHVRALKSCMWLAYIGADAVAIYALSALFNRYKAPAGGGGDDVASSSSSSRSPLEILWAPVLLLHLGGQHTFTAYSIEDNELWGRHLVTLASQVTVALYVFCRSWSGSGGSDDKKLMQAAILLFVVGILKFAQKPWALRAASLNSVMTSLAVYPQRRAQKTAHMSLFSCVTHACSVDAVELRDAEDHDLSLDEYVEKARDLALATEVDPSYRLKQDFSRTAKQFVDLSDPYSRRLRDRDLLPSYLKLGLQGLVVGLQQRLGWSFVMIYTDCKTACSVPGLLLKLLLPFITLSSAVLFGQSHKDGYRDKDVRVTYILLWCSTVLAFLPFFMCPCLFGVVICSVTAAQHNLISFSARRMKPSMLMKFSGIMGFKGYINKHWYTMHESSSSLFLHTSTPQVLRVASTSLEVIGLVHEHVKDGWKRFIVDGASYRRFNNLRGQWAMVGKHKAFFRGDPRRLLWSLQVPFDHSVLVWHVATELCIHHPRTSLPVDASVQESAARRRSRLLSNYMIYLLFIRPEMLLPGTRQELFTNTSDDMEVMLKHAGWPPSPDGASMGVAQQILRAAQSPTLDTSRLGPWILKACKLAEDLMELLDDDQRWLLIQDVWVEMLCYSAGRCRGYLHAKTMGEGVEFLTYVWLLLSSMGMETFADKFQRPDPAQGEETELYIDPGDWASQPRDILAEDAITIAVE